MKKSIVVMIATLLLTSVLLAACGSTPLTADQVLQKMAENGKNLKTGHTQMDINMTAAEQTVTMNAVGVFENPDKSYLNLTLLGSSVQMLVLSPTEVYQRASESEAWVQSDASGSDQAGSVYDFTKNPEQLLKYYHNATLLTEEQVDGVDCYHVSFELDVMEMMKAAGISETTLAGIVFTGPAQVESWIGKSDFFTRKLNEKFVMTTEGQEVSMDVLVSLTEINQPVEIPTP